MIITLPKYLRFLLPKWVAAIALLPFIIFREEPQEVNAVLLNHEKIHLKQQLELFVLFFYLVYVAEYLFLLIKFRNHHRAYRGISFEREAYQYDNDLSYLQDRKAYAQWRR